MPESKPKGPTETREWDENQHMSKYSVLVKILDQIRNEAEPAGFTAKYIASTTDNDQANHERSRAFVHLFLKVQFGELDFARREHFITDGPNDGGIDGYYVDPERKLIYFLQSKFRTTETSFANKQITLDELLAMDVARVVEGYEEDQSGHPYNGKILGLQREIRAIPDIARYKYQVVLLANIDTQSPEKLSRIVGGFPCEVFDHEKCYEQLVFPVISGTYFNAPDLVIHLDLSNKNAGSKISYTVDTRLGECEITVLFVPTIEVARAFHKYKNSILKFNPRSYLELEGTKVNEAIRATILQPGKNEFALYNNGITMLSDETDLNERIGQRNKARLNAKNPQIINGGQTAYTLSRIYEEHPSEADTIFEGKEVLLKVITLSAAAGSPETERQKANLIEAISEATNLQTAVITADRYSNEEVNLRLQKILFDSYGLLYERKRGEFADGVRNGYIDRNQILERNLFFRIFFAANGDLKRAIQKRLFTKLSRTGWAVPEKPELDRFYFAFECFLLLDPKRTAIGLPTKEIYAKLYAMAAHYLPADIRNFGKEAKRLVPEFESEWALFVEGHVNNDPRFVKARIDRDTGRMVRTFNKRKWIMSGQFLNDMTERFSRPTRTGSPRVATTSHVGASGPAADVGKTPADATPKERGRR